MQLRLEVVERFRAKNKDHSELTAEQISKLKKASEREKSRRAKKHALGICTYGKCAEPTPLNAWECEAHVKIKRESQKRAKQRRIIRGRCASSSRCDNPLISKWYCAEHIAKRGRWARMERYGVSGAQFNAMLVDQDGCCAVCRGQSKRWHLDHDHATGAVRGILCHGCNVALGYAKDNDLTLRALADYVVLHRFLNRKAS